MPRTARASAANYCYHVLNRGNARAEVFHKPGDYDAFLELIDEAGVRIPMRLLGYCLMPNHFHLVAWPRGDGDLSRWMQWLLTSHVRRHHRHYHSSGHVWQGRPSGLTPPLRPGESLRPAGHGARRRRGHQPGPGASQAHIVGRLPEPERTHRFC